MTSDKALSAPNHAMRHMARRQAVTTGHRERIATMATSAGASFQFKRCRARSLPSAAALLTFDYLIRSAGAGAAPSRIAPWFGPNARWVFWGVRPRLILRGPESQVDLV